MTEKISSRRGSQSVGRGQGIVVLAPSEIPAGTRKRLMPSPKLTGTAAYADLKKKLKLRFAKFHQDSDGAADAPAETFVPFSGNRRRLVIRAIEEAVWLVENLPADQVKVLEKSNSRKSILEIAARHARAPEMIDASGLLAARLKGEERKRALIAAAGGLVSSSDAAKLLGITPQALHKRFKNGLLIAIKTSAGDLGYPRFQLETESMTESIAQVLRDLPVDEPLMRLSFMFSEMPELGGATPAALLKAGRIREVKIAASHFGEQGAA